VQVEVKVKLTLNVKLSLSVPLRFTGGAQVLDLIVNLCAIDVGVKFMPQQL